MMNSTSLDVIQMEIKRTYTYLQETTSEFFFNSPSSTNGHQRSLMVKEFNMLIFQMGYLARIILLGG